MPVSPRLRFNPFSDNADDYIKAVERMHEQDNEIEKLQGQVDFLASNRDQLKRELADLQKEKTEEIMEKLRYKYLAEKLKQKLAPVKRKPGVALTVVPKGIQERNRKRREKQDD